MEEEKAKRTLKDRFPKKLINTPLKERPIAAFLPNMATIIGLCSGLTSVKMALIDRYDLALLAVLVAAVMDAMDGRIARYLDRSTRFGAELDSFSDLICFGLSPALIMYFKSVKDLGEFGWALVLFCTVCMALRLARFNVQDIEGVQENWQQGYFTGVPAPAAAFLLISPLFYEKQFGFAFLTNPFLCAIIMVIVGALMVSNVPTFSLKGIKVSNKNIIPLMIGVALTASLLLTEPYLVLCVISAIYLFSFPYSYYAFKKKTAV